MTINFLLGSGISIPAGFPSVERITNLVLSGEDFVIEQNGSVGPLEGRPLSPELIEQGRMKLRRILILLDWLKVQANSRFAEDLSRRPNYEDLAFLAGQIHDDLINEYENPALQPFVRNALIDLGGLFGKSAPDRAREELMSLAGSTVDYIRGAVAMKLRGVPETTDYLQLFVDACNDKQVSRVNFFTLNHDTLLDDFLRTNGVNLTDGFRKSKLGEPFRRWDSSVFEEPNGGRHVRLFKLHGSIDWYRWRRTVPQSATPREDSEFIGIYKKSGDSGNDQHELARPHEGPQMLVGTFNKIFDYNSGLFLDLHYQFQRALRACKILVVCGYGFGDKGVNTRIAEWRGQSSKNELLIIDPKEPGEMVRVARGAIQKEIAALAPDETTMSSPDGPVCHWRHGLEERQFANGERIVAWERLLAKIN